MKKPTVTYPMEGQDKTPRTTKWSGDKQPSRKRIQNNGSEGSGENSGEDAGNVYQKLRRTKEQGSGNLPGGPVIKTLLSTSGGAGLVSSSGAKIPHALGPENWNIEQK